MRTHAQGIMSLSACCMQTPSIRSVRLWCQDLLFTLYFDKVDVSLISHLWNIDAAPDNAMNP